MKDIFVEAFDIKKIDGQAQIISQLVNIVDKISVGYIESNEKLMDWFAKTFENKIIDRIFITIVN